MWHASCESLLRLPSTLLDFHFLFHYRLGFEILHVCCTEGPASVGNLVFIFINPIMHTLTQEAFL